MANHKWSQTMLQFCGVKFKKSQIYGDSEINK
jgi:hypothetical protein